MTDDTGQTARPETPATTDPIPATPLMMQITGKQLSMAKRQLLANLVNNYNSFIQLVGQLHGDEELKNDSLELFDRAYLRMQEAIIALKVILIPQPPAPQETTEKPTLEEVIKNDSA